MGSYLPFVLAGLLVLGVVMWSVTTHRRKRRAQEDALARLGFAPCLDRKNWLEETVAAIENNRGYRYEVHDPKCLPGGSPLYYYVKRRSCDDHEDSFAEEEILFALKRPSAAGLVLTVKPSSLAPGLATRLIGAVATGPWDAQPDDLQRLDLPLDLKDTNLLAVLGPRGASLYDLVDTQTLSVVLGLGDAGAMFVRFRDTWCTVASAGAQTPFRVEELVARIQPLL